MKIIKCDYCLEEIKTDEYIELGSNDGKSLMYVNRFYGDDKFPELKELRQYTNLHFCCRKHFLEYFFKCFDV